MQFNFQICIFIGATIPALIAGFGGTEEKFIKKYAMMKVYESCFGSQVLKEIRREMKEAAQKCAGMSPQYDDKYFNKEGNNIKPGPNGEWPQEQPPYRAKPTSGSKVKKPIHTTDTLLLQQWTEEQKQTNSDTSTPEEQDQLETESANGMELETTSPSIKPVDFSKLEEAIMNIGRPMPSTFAVQKPSSSNSNFQQSAAVGYYPAMYYPPPMPFAPSYPYHAYYPGYFQAPGPAAGSAAFQSYYRSGLRSAKLPNYGIRTRKQMDVKTHIDAVAFQYSTKLRNISCILQELGYLDENLEPNYPRMTEKIGNLHISEDLKKDMLDGVKFCRQFSQCLPETKRDPFQLSKELLRPMFFFRCYKHKKLEACIMKDIRERFTQTSAELNNEVRRSFRNNEIVGNMFDSLFGSSGDDFESFF